MGKLDKIIEGAIGEMFQDSTVPDSNNYLPEGNQYKAPDHSILNGTVLIERKSRNAVDNSQFYDKFHKISCKQEQPFVAFGIFNLGEAIKKLPNPQAASTEISDYFHSQILKRVKEADKKFKEHKNVVGELGQTRILILSDESEIVSTTSFTEHFLGRKMGGNGNDETGLIDAIIYVKNPKFVLDDFNGYWFKLLTKKRLSSDHIAIVTKIASAIRSNIANRDEYRYESLKFYKSSFQPLLV